MSEPKQKLIVVDIDAGTKTFLDQKLVEGFVITQMVSLTPVYDKLLIIYAIPEEPVIP